MGIFSLLPDFGVASGEEEGVWIANFCANQAKITRRIEQTWVPTFPVGEQDFDLFAQIHSRNVTEHPAADNALYHSLLFE